MKSEIEVKFLAVNHDMIRAKLAEIGAACEQPSRLMRRVIFDDPALKEKNAFVRVRDEGSGITITYKQFDSLSIDGAKEIEVTVNDFDAAVELIKSTGLSARSIQESKRETWLLGATEIVLDEWPWLKPYIEIEGASEQELKDTADKLGLDWNDAVFGDVMAAYRAEYPWLDESQTIGTIAEVRFDDPLPELLVSQP
jgi:adenylate cyclase class 2